MQIPGWLQLTAIGLAGMVLSVVLYAFADRAPYSAPSVDSEYEP